MICGPDTRSGGGGDTPRWLHLVLFGPGLSGFRCSQQDGQVAGPRSKVSTRAFAKTRSGDHRCRGRGGRWPPACLPPLTRRCPYAMRPAWYTHASRPPCRPRPGRRPGQAQQQAGHRLAREIRNGGPSTLIWRTGHPVRRRGARCAQTCSCRPAEESSSSTGTNLEYSQGVPGGARCSVSWG